MIASRTNSLRVIPRRRASASTARTSLRGTRTFTNDVLFDTSLPHYSALTHRYATGVSLSVLCRNAQILGSPVWRKTTECALRAIVLFVGVNADPASQTMVRILWDPKSQRAGGDLLSSSLSLALLAFLFRTPGRRPCTPSLHPGSRQPTAMFDFTLVAIPLWSPTAKPHPQNRQRRRRESAIDIPFINAWGRRIILSEGSVNVFLSAILEWRNY